MPVDATLNSGKLDKIINKHVSNGAEPWQRIIGDVANRVQEINSGKAAEVSPQDRGAVRVALIKELKASHDRPMYVSFTEVSQGGKRAMLLFVSPKGALIVASSLHLTKAAILSAYVPDGCRCWKDVARSLVMRYKSAIIDPTTTVSVPQSYDDDRRLIKEQNILFIKMDYFGATADGNGLTLYPMEDWPGALPCPAKANNKAGRPANQQPLRGGLN